MTDVAIEEIYQGLFDDDAFAALPTVMGRTANARSAMIHWRHLDGAHQTFAYDYYTADHIRRFDAFFEHDIWSAAASRPQYVNSLVNCEALVSRETYERSIFYNEFVRPSGDDTFYAAGIAFDSPGGGGFLAVQRGRTQKTFDDEDLRGLAPYAAALKQVLMVRGELASRAQALNLARATLDLIDVPLIATDAEGRITQCNAAAEAVLAQTDGLTSRQGRLEAVGPDPQAALRLAIYRATRSTHPQGSTVVIDRRAAPGFVVSVTPLRTVGAKPLALLSFHDRSAQAVAPVARLRQLFGLTPQEAQVATELARGRSIADIAAESRTSIHTVRTQAKVVLSKTGVSRQAELVALLAGLTLPSGGR